MGHFTAARRVPLDWQPVVDPAPRVRDAIPVDVRVTEDGHPRMTEAGEPRIVE